MSLATLGWACGSAAVMWPYEVVPIIRIVAPQMLLYYNVITYHTMLTTGRIRK
jgi:hypothetical protein